MQEFLWLYFLSGFATLFLLALWGSDMERHIERIPGDDGVWTIGDVFRSVIFIALALWSLGAVLIVGAIVAVCWTCNKIGGITIWKGKKCFTI